MRKIHLSLTIALLCVVVINHHEVNTLNRRVNNNLDDIHDLRGLIKEVEYLDLENHYLRIKVGELSSEMKNNKRNFRRIGVTLNTIKSFVKEQQIGSTRNELREIVNVRGEYLSKDTMNEIVFGGYHDTSLEYLRYLKAVASYEADQEEMDRAMYRAYNDYRRKVWGFDKEEDVQP